MASPLQRLTVRGETFEYRAPNATANEIAQHVENILDADTTSGKFFPAVRGLMLRQADTIEPEGADRCDLARRVFGDEHVRRRIVERGALTPEEPRLTAVDLSYGQLITLGSYEQRNMRYTPAQSRGIYVISLWIGEGVTIGRGYELVESPYQLPKELANVYRKPSLTLDRSLPIEQRETFRTLLRDGMSPREALETASLL